MSENTENLPAVPEQKSVVPLVEGKGLMPKDMDGLWRLSVIMSQSGFVPTDMINKTESVFVACQLGYELGLSPMQSVQNISVINGRPTVWGDTVLALVRSSGKLTSFEEKFEGAGDDMKAICTAVRGKEKTVREFSVADAKAAKLWGQNAWAKYAKRMMQMRARSWCLRDAFGDILKGIQSREEVMDYVDLEETENGTYQTKKPPEETPEKVDTSQFDDLAAAQPDFMLAKLSDFLEVTAKANDSTVDGLKLAAGKAFDSFWGNYEKWFYPKALEHAISINAEAYNKSCEIHGCVGFGIEEMKPIQQKAVYETFRKMKQN